MGRADSSHLRERISAHVSAGYSCRAAARRFGVSPSCAIKLMQHVTKTGSATPRRQGRPSGAGKLAQYLALLIRWVEAAPDITMPELADRLAAVRWRTISSRRIGLRSLSSRIAMMAFRSAMRCGSHPLASNCRCSAGRSNM